MGPAPRALYDPERKLYHILDSAASKTLQSSGAGEDRTDSPIWLSYG